MPKLEQYIAPSKDIRPDNQGYQAFETEGRRIGGMYREQAQDTIAAAKANAAALTDKAQWPFTLFALKQKFMPKPAPGVGFKVSGGLGSGFPRETMPNLAAANAADQAAENFPNPLASSLSPQGARDTRLAAEAANLTQTMRGLIGYGDQTGGFGGPQAPGPNAAAEASANTQPIYGIPSSTGIGSNANSGGDYGGGGDFAPADAAPVSSAPVTDLGGGAFGGM